MARATKEQSEVTARRILEVAGGLFGARGYADVGLEEVAALAQVTRGAVYHHYGNKQTLFATVAAQAQRRVARTVSEAAETAGGSWDGLVAGCRAFLDASVAGTHRRILLVDAPAVLGWNTWREQDAAASGELLTEALTELAHDGVIAVHSPAAAAALLSGAMNEAALRIAEGACSTDEVWPDLLGLLNGLRTGKQSSAWIDGAKEIHQSVDGA